MVKSCVVESGLRICDGQDYKSLRCNPKLVFTDSKRIYDKQDRSKSVVIESYRIKMDRTL